MENIQLISSYQGLGAVTYYPADPKSGFQNTNKVKISKYINKAYDNRFPGTYF